MTTTSSKRALEHWQIEDAKRLKSLFKTRSALSQTEFGQEFGLGSQGMVWQYLSGKRALNFKAAKAFAQGLGVSIDTFSPTIASQALNVAQHTEGAASKTGSPWPFPQISAKKLAMLTERDRTKLQESLLLTARHLGLDVAAD